MGWQARLRHLDDRVLGRPVPDSRSLVTRVLTPTPHVRTAKGRVAMAIVLIGMLVNLRWGGDGTGSMVALVVLAAAMLAAVAWDGRLLSRRYHGGRNEE